MQLGFQYFRTLSRQLLLMAIITIGLGGVAGAQNFNPAYRVDNAIITHYEIDQMAQLLTVLGQPADAAREQAVDRLINYQLLKNLTARTNANFGDDQIQIGLRAIAPNGDVSALYGQMGARGVSRNTVDKYAESQFLINSYLDSRGVDLRPSDDEIVARIGNIPDQTRDLIIISEMVIPYAEYGGRIPTRLAASQIRERLRNGESFAALAREKSRSSTAADGGRLAPIPREALNPQLSQILRTTPVGGVAEPIELEGAIVLLQYTGNSTQRISLPRDPRVSYIELFVPARGDLAKSQKTAAQILRAVDSCQEATAMLNGKVGRFDNVPVRALSSGMNLALGRMAVGAKQIFERENGTSVLMLCGRNVAVPAELQPQVDNAILAQAIDGRARGALLELRNQARVVKVD